MTKILVDEIPKNSKECPFVLSCDDKRFPDVCKLKIGETSRFGISFGRGHNYNCSICENEECNHLKEINTN